jgi:CelD/BcsL family acetyltransferase involved in cellulose biosynthesis
VATAYDWAAVSWVATLGLEGAVLEGCRSEGAVVAGLCIGTGRGQAVDKVRWVGAAGALEEAAICA